MSEVKDCPGFALLTSEETGFTWRGMNFAKCTTHFNVPRATSTHGGIDLAPGGVKTPIISFIYGKVWACTWDKSITENDSKGLGKLMVIRDLHESKLYLLCHLDDYIKKEGDHIHPGDEIALTGTTGWSTGIHLHLEVRECFENKKDNVLDSSANKRYPESGLAWIKSKYQPQQLNPFNHLELHNFKYWEYE